MRSSSSSTRSRGSGRSWRSSSSRFLRPRLAQLAPLQAGDSLARVFKVSDKPKLGSRPPPRDGQPARRLARGSRTQSNAGQPERAASARARSEERRVGKERRGRRRPYVWTRTSNLTATDVQI